MYVVSYEMLDVPGKAFFFLPFTEEFLDVTKTLALIW